ncbi:ATP-binding protein [[Eubacterium] cellulosolvens]
MKQITVISGKGGTGKTTITAAFASLAKNAVFADCDVDAADLHLILNPEILETIEFSGMKLAIKDMEKCTDCGECQEHCRFGAIDDEFNIIAERCEGCGVCEFVCPVEAIAMTDRKSGLAYKSTTRFGPMAHAVLNTAEEASGKLVNLVRNHARLMAAEKKNDLIIIDGPPGIGCPVISAITGVDLVLLVTEPTLSGIHDLDRILGVAGHFNIPSVVCINKVDINPENVNKIELYCRKNNIPIVGKLSYDNVATTAMIAGKTVVEYNNDNKLSDELKNMWNKIRKILEAS